MAVTNYYLSKYVGKYRVVAEIDKNTNDFCRNDKMELENNQDIYIKCHNGIKIFHYGRNILQVYIPSIGKGRNIIRTIYRNYIKKDNTEIETVKTIRNIKNVATEIERENIIVINNELYEKDIYSLTNKDIIYNVEETDSEVLFKIKDKNLEKIIKLLKPQTSGAGISPFSSKNLPKNSNKKYMLSIAQIEEYKKITDRVPKEDKLKLGQITNRFISEIMCKKLRNDLKIDIKPEMKRLMIRGKEYINYKGFLNEYLNYLQQETESGGFK